MFRAILALVALAFIAMAASSGARACGIAGPIPHVVEPDARAADHVAPSLPEPTVQRIVRGRAPERSGCGWAASSCDDIGSVTVRTGAVDDMTPTNRIAYRLTLVAGSPPTGLDLPSHAAVYSADGFVLHWVDGATGDQEDIDFTLQVVAVDLAGNESAPQTARIRDVRGGCRIAAFPLRSARAAASALLIGLLAILAILAARSPLRAR